MRFNRRGGRTVCVARGSAAGRILGLLCGAWLAAVAPQAAPAETDSCVTCHQNPEFLVTNKKLYEYYQQWEASIHNQEGVTCDECHGGNPRARDKQVAHGKGMGADDPDSGIHFKAVSKTCGRCHEDILQGFTQSSHFEHVDKIEDERQGPTCVTCHGAINVEILNVLSIEQSCSRCHNDTTRNHPEIPEKARLLMNRFLSIHRLYRYISTNSRPAEASTFFRELDPALRRLSVTWHTFDTEAVEEESGQILQTLKTKREEIRRRRAEQAAAVEAQGSRTEGSKAGSVAP